MLIYQTSKTLFSLVLFSLIFTCSYSQSHSESSLSNTSDTKILVKENRIQKNKQKSLHSRSDSVMIDSLRMVIVEAKRHNLAMKKLRDEAINKKKQANSKLDDYKTYMPITGVLFSFALISLGFISMRSKKRLNSAKNSIKKLYSEIDEAKSEIKRHKEQEESLLKNTQTLQEEIQTLRSNSEKTNLISINSGHNFFAQVLLSAGPRKSSRDSELGEDTAGFCIDRDRVFFWVLDGTSDSPIVAHGRKEIISSRLLAQHLGINLQKGINNNDPDSESWLINAIQATEKQWQKIISELSEEAKRDVVEDLAGRANIADVSTTALVGIINSDGKASIARIGDSKIFCLNHEDKLIEDELTQRPRSDSYGRLYARATHEKDSITLEFTNSMDVLRLHDTTIYGVKTVLAFSDGIGPITENFLREHSNKFPLEDIQQTIVNIPQQTYDDKSLIMVQIR